MIHRRTLLGSALAAPFLSFLPRAAHATEWPGAGPIRLVVAQGGGGNADVVSRILVEALEPLLGQSIVVENNGTASGMRATEDVSNARPMAIPCLSAPPRSWFTTSRSSSRCRWISRPPCAVSP